MQNTKIADVRLITPMDSGYRAFVSRKRAEKAALRADRTAATRVDLAACASSPAGMAHPIIHPIEILHVDSQPLLDSLTASATPQSQRRAPLGKMVETAVCDWLGRQIKLECNRIITWRERTDFGWSRHYAELDAIHCVDYDTLMVFEVKFLTVDKMVGQAGTVQLNSAERLLNNAPCGRRIIKRLVYVGDGSIRIPGVPVVDVSDDSTSLGVLWMDQFTIQAYSASRGVAMPEGWPLQPNISAALFSAYNQY